MKSVRRVYRDIVCRKSSNEYISEIEQIEAKVKRLLLLVREEKIMRNPSCVTIDCSYHDFSKF
jgi:hypothetical protein